MIRNSLLLAVLAATAAQARREQNARRVQRAGGERENVPVAEAAVKAQAALANV